MYGKTGAAWGYSVLWYSFPAKNLSDKVTNGFLFCHSPLQAHKANLKGKNDRMTKCAYTTCARKDKIIEYYTYII